MMALTIWQPWCTLIVEGCKPFEYRRHARCKPFVGQRVALHAGARKMRRDEIADLYARLEHEPALTGLTNLGRAFDILDIAWRSPEKIPLSAVLGAAILGQPKAASEIHGDSDRVDQHVFGWPLTDVQRFDPPIPARGARGFWDWRDTKAAA
jgi:hypothetical protein